MTPTTLAFLSAAFLLGALAATAALGAAQAVVGLAAWAGWMVGRRLSR